MTFTTPNSAGFPDLEETNTASSHAWLLNQVPGQRKRKKLARVREYNNCHAPESGRFCSTKSGNFQKDQAWDQKLRDDGLVQIRRRPGTGPGSGERFWVPLDHAREVVRRGEADIHKADAHKLKTAPRARAWTPERRYAAWGRSQRRQASAGPRASRVMSRLEKQMQRVDGNVGRAVTLRKRMDVASPLAVRHRQNSFIGTVKRVYRGKKR